MMTILSMNIWSVIRFKTIYHKGNGYYYLLFHLSSFIIQFDGYGDLVILQNFLSFHHNLSPPHHLRLTRLIIYVNLWSNNCIIIYVNVLYNINIFNSLSILIKFNCFYFFKSCNSYSSSRCL